MNTFFPDASRVEFASEAVLAAHGTGSPSVAVVIPCFKVRGHIENVIRSLGSNVARVYVVDDCCPQKTGDFVESLRIERVVVLRHTTNQGVGGAVVTGYRRASADGYRVIVKIDGDGQMDVRQIPALVGPILSGRADYTKGNRLFDLSYVRSMPPVRLFGNAALSFISKIVSGYWGVMDPTNGFTAIHGSLVPFLPLEKLSRRYFFESDMLFHLGNLRAVVRDVPIPAIYGNEVSNLRIGTVLREFPIQYGIRFLKRIFFTYFLRDFNAGSLAFLAGLPLFLFGLLFGVWAWVHAAASGAVASSGTVMLAALPFAVGAQLLIGFLAFDVTNAPREPLAPILNALASPDR